jgi:HEAT repeat protein
VTMNQERGSFPDDPDQRRRLAEEIGLGGDRDRVNVLARLLRDEDVDVRLAAVESLEVIGKEAEAAEGQEGHGDSETQANCAIALVVALGDENAHIRWRAARALGALGSREAAFPLVRLLKDENIHVAWAAVDALESIGDPSSAPEIEKFKKSRYRAGG